MKKQKPPAREPVQLHIDPTPAETTPEYTLEDIMNEFKAMIEAYVAERWGSR